MFEITEIETDAEAEEKGIWRDYKSGSKLLIARLNNAKYRSMIRSKVKSQRAILDNEDDLADKVTEDIVLECTAKTILLGWQGITMNQVNVEYDSKTALKLLKASREFRDTVRAMAEDAEQYRKKREDDATGNSPALSTGT